MRAFNGVYPAVVVDNVDPENTGRVKVRLPEAQAEQHAMDAWARIATLMAGNNRGTWFIPDVGDEVLVAFERGDLRVPYVLGALWSGAAAPPVTAVPGNNRKLLRSRSGVTVTFDDQDGHESIVIETPGGQRLTLSDGPGAIVISDGNGNSVALEPNGITLSAPTRVTVKASMVEINAAIVSVDASVSKFNGIVQCDTLVSNNVVSASYTPGAGNIW